jgi:hypothetical protein
VLPSPAEPDEALKGSTYPPTCLERGWGFKNPSLFHVLCTKSPRRAYSLECVEVVSLLKKSS